MRNLLEGALLVVVVLFAFLLDLRAALIVALVIPLSLASAFAYLHARGMAANLIYMGSVDFGIIVDGAVVMIEAMPSSIGALVPLPALGDISVDYGRASISRENGQRYVGLRMNVRGRDLGSSVNDARTAIARHLPRAAGVSMEWGGEHSDFG